MLKDILTPVHDGVVVVTRLSTGKFNHGLRVRVVELDLHRSGKNAAEFCRHKRRLDGGSNIQKRPASVKVDVILCQGSLATAIQYKSPCSPVAP